MPKRDPVLAALGASVRRHRTAGGLTQETLAEKAGLDPTYISGIERGLRNPGIKNVAKLAKALGLSTSELCKGVDA
jgi:transcriptional regulator with XRE-family HTH domain